MKMKEGKGRIGLDTLPPFSYTHFRKMKGALSKLRPSKVFQAW
jgi:hypothetical protein